MNEDEILNLIKSNVISNKEMELLYSKYTNDPISFNDMWTIKHSLTASTDYDYGTLVFNRLKDVFNRLKDNDKELRKKIAKIVKLWTGVYKTGFKALTPDLLTSLNEQCNQIATCVANRDSLLPRCFEYGYSQEEVSDFAQTYSHIEKAVVYCITQSWCASTGKNTDADQQDVLANLIGLNISEEINTNMLQIITVSPWDMPPLPPLVIPERPAVILEVMKVGEGWVNAGWEDLFNPIVMVECLEVDEPLSIGDRIIVKGSKWNPKTSLIQEPEYDGIAEPECPLSTEEELLELRYEFNPEQEQERLYDNHKKAWMKSNWIAHTEEQLCKIADGKTLEEIFDEAISDLIAQI